MNPEDILTDSGAAALTVVGTEAFQELMGSTLRLTAPELIAHIDPRDTPGLLVPAFVCIGGKNQPGCLLALSDRVVIAWSAGVLRPKSSIAVLPYSSIERIDHDVRPESRASWGRAVLRVEAEQSWTFEFVDKVFEGGTNIVPLLALVLEGVAKPVWRDPDDAEAALQAAVSHVASGVEDSHRSRHIPPPPNPIPPPPAPIPAPSISADEAAPTTPSIVTVPPFPTPRGARRGESSAETDESPHPLPPPVPAAIAPAPQDAAIQILRQRLASGEIELTEFQELLAILREK